MTRPLPWCTDNLGRVMTLQRGYDLPSRLRKAGVVPIVSSSGISDFHSVAVVEAPGVVTGRYGTIGQTFYLEENFWPLNTTLFVSNFHGNDPKFCYYVLKTIDFASHSGKSGVPGINRNDIHEIALSVPTEISEQQAIAKALGDADALIEGLGALIAKKRDIKRGAMEDLLTGERRLPGFQEEWKSTSVGEVCPLQRGYDLPNAQLEAGDFPVIYSNGAINFHRVPMIKGPGVVTGRSGTIGSVMFVEGDYWPHNTTLFVHDFIDSLPKFIYYFLQHIDLSRFSTGSGVPTLNRNDVHSHEVLLPPTLEEQDAIAAMLTDMDAEIGALEEKLAKARAIKQGMMQGLLTGEIRLI